MRSLSSTLLAACAIMLVLLLAGCSAWEVNPAATADPRPTLEAMQEQVVGTVLAALTKNAPTAVPFTPTQPSATPLPTQTSSPTRTSTPTPAWTATSTATPTSTFTPTAKPATLTPTAGAWGCAVLDFSPERFAVLSSGSNFKGIWVVKNAGKEKWIYSDTDIRYASGTKFQRFYDVLDLERDIASGESITINVDMRAPADLGTYSTTWNIARGSQVICTMILTIIVK